MESDLECKKFVYTSAQCDSALGLEKKVWDSQLTAQSHPIHIILENGLEMDTHARCGRLNLPYCAICGSSKIGQYFQVDLRQDYTIIGVATQGFEALNNNYFVGSYNLSRSRDGKNWSIFQEVMKGNDDGRSVVRHTFSSPMCARYVRLYPTAYSHGGFCVRMELYGCSNCSSLLSKTPLPTTLQHGANDTTPENLPPTTRTTAAPSTEMPLIINSATDQPVGSSEVLITTQGGEKALPTESETLNITTPMVRDNSSEGSSKTLIIAPVVVALALVIIIICSLVAWRRRQRSKGNYHCNPRKEMPYQSNGSSFEIETTERNGIARGSNPEVTISAV
ncbi:discoidin, CUB and LCCL domain-containing protein 2-like [Acropora millepora]|uniref:discoidin, CUB and LCCL domain-containing protein 2-like n=1 Tax=Acropora millepora TaxID=45264 RepID=UPI001CF28B42|nr:discoidin, CUB and LCCL domain-containing protein 2-like [Acropora millepora]